MIIVFLCRRPSSVVSAVVVVLRPSSVPSVRPRRPSSSSSVRPVRPSSVVVPYLQIRGRMQIFEKLIKIEVPRPRDYEIQNLREKCCRFLGSILKRVPGKYVLWMIYFSIRILVPMLIITLQLSLCSENRLQESSAILNQLLGGVRQ